MKVFSLLLCALIVRISAYKVAIFTPQISNSQVMFNKRVAETLADAGHDVTMIIISQFVGLDTSAVKIAENVKTHYVNGSTTWTHDDVEKMQSTRMFQDAPLWDAENRKFLQMFTDSMTATCRRVVQNKEFLQWLKGQKFDIAFSHMYNTCPIGIIYTAKIPSWIWLNSGMLMDYVATTVGVPTIPSYVPPMPMEAHDRMTFFERLKSNIGHGLFQIIWPRLLPARETHVFREEVDPNFPDILDMARDW